jgi:pimeloyl-ACP methyl ester carboxylesterase
MDIVRHKKINIEGLNIFYREAGPAGGPTVLLLHGWPASSHMFRNLIPELADRFHLIAPDYPGFGYSDAPSVDDFEYSFDHLSTIVEKMLDALGITKVSMYVQDYGGPIGFRIAERRPDLIRAIVVQNAVAHMDGISDALNPLVEYWQDQSELKEEAVRKFLHKDTTILQLFYDYQTNPANFSAWQNYFRRHKPPMLVVWGANDPFFTPAGAQAFAKDNPNASVKLLNAGHFALEEYSTEIATEMRALADRVKSGFYAEQGKLLK